MATEYPERHELLEEVRALRRELADSHPPSATDGRVRYQSVVDNVIDGIITIPLAVMGYLFFPNLPQGGIKTWWTTQSEHELSVSRLKAVGRAGKQPWTLAKVKKIAFSWHTWTLRKY